MRVGFTTRFGAALIDGGILTLALHLVVFVDVLLAQARLAEFGVITAILGGAMLILYGLLDVYVNGTPGKKLLKLTIAADDGSSPTVGMLLRRWGVKYVGLFFGLIGGVMMWLAEELMRGQWSYSVREGVFAVGVIDLCIGILLIVIMAVTTLMAFNPNHRPLHDTLSGTTLFRQQDLLQERGFEPVVPEARRYHSESDPRLLPPPVPERA